MITQYHYKTQDTIRKYKGKRSVCPQRKAARLAELTLNGIRENRFLLRLVTENGFSRCFGEVTRLFFYTWLTKTIHRDKQSLPLTFFSIFLCSFLGLIALNKFTVSFR